MGSAGIAFMAVFLAMESYRLERIAIWQHPEKYEKGYQTLQGLYAIGSGGLFGRGLGNSVQKLGFLPEAQNDMIFSIICEELGLVGASAIVLLFLILIYITVTLPGRKSDTVTSQGRMPGTRRVVVQFRRLQKRRRRAPYPSLSFHFPRSGTNTSPNSFESRPGFSPLTNYVTTTEQTWLTNMVYAPLI